MPNYNLDGLGSEQFEFLVQALLKEIIGAGTITFGAGKDGGREATFKGKAPYPSSEEKWSGSWIFQAKFHDTSLLGVENARKAVMRDLGAELEKITMKHAHPCDNYILATNVPLTGVYKTGNLDTIEHGIASKYVGNIKNIHVWGHADISKFLEKYVSIRTAYLQYIVPGDVLAQLLDGQKTTSDEIALTIRDYVQTTFSREQNAQLDQAGDVSDEPVQLQQVFIDLTAKAMIDSSHHGATANHVELRKLEAYAKNVLAESLSPLSLLVNESLHRVVVVGGPGEGKSTIGQYLSQLHRAVLLGKVDDIALDPSFVPLLPRIPLRVILRDFAQWLARTGDSTHIPVVASTTTWLPRFVRLQVESFPSTIFIKL